MAKDPATRPSFQEAFGAEAGDDFALARAYWLGKCAERVYPNSEAEKAAEKKAKVARALERQLRPRFWRRGAKARPEELERARAAAEEAKREIASTEAARMENDVREWGFNRDFQFFSSISTQCFVAASEELVVLCFRGTEPNRPMDIYHDLLALPMRDEFVAGELHTGFLQALKQVWRDETAKPLLFPDADDRAAPSGLVEALQRFRDPKVPQRVWIAGHSLGGALATVAAARLVGLGVLAPDEIGGVYTYGQPRVGDDEFAECYALHRKHFRVVHDNDVVTRVPPESLSRIESLVRMFLPEVDASGSRVLSSLQYRHVGRVAYLGAGVVELDLPKWRLSLTRLLRRLAAPFEAESWFERLLPGVPDHDIKKYNSVLKIAPPPYPSWAGPSPLVPALTNALGLAGRLRFPMKGPGRSSMSNQQRPLPGGLEAQGAAKPAGQGLSILSGACVGLLVGTLLGLSLSPTAKLVVGALASSLSLVLGLNDRYFGEAKAWRIAAFGVFMIAGLLAGTYTRTNHLLSPSLGSVIAGYTDNGYSLEDARYYAAITRVGSAADRSPSLGSLIAEFKKNGYSEEDARRYAAMSFARAVDSRSRGGDGEGSEARGADWAQRVAAGGLMAAKIKGETCDDLRDLTDQKTIGERFLTAEAIWERMAKGIEKAYGRDTAEAYAAFERTRNGICGPWGKGASFGDGCKVVTAAGPGGIADRFRRAGPDWERVLSAVIQGEPLAQPDELLEIIAASVCHPEER